MVVKLGENEVLSAPLIILNKHVLFFFSSTDMSSRRDFPIATSSMHPPAM
jgi:hypothetical protein